MSSMSSNEDLLREIEQLKAKNEALAAKLASFEKGASRFVYDINVLNKYPALKGSFYTLQSYGACGNDELLSKLGAIVRNALFADEKVTSQRRTRNRGEIKKVEIIPRLSDISDMQYSYYLKALNSIFKVVSDTVIEYRDVRKEANK